ncbi:deubiquitination module subunit SGF73 KNAG_0F01950 [Huiozyma naganishii CBS 8797]|uniref:SCA7 domain-containing protein n=1 Tax=Huiozyma naganishii (strain ATCC MYA-139 / BCRC 22969 / CBS 8797 / KCTC 17520 / NBRC 10181 / NCYC 3082 / Yp74L-3) TaxID=1071383 RepID=J7RMR6_HUIN7|nr:hypothetical protein KNAG_0F01950 [Kazachstania naganishii CBS 8797]CCK70863.1 hypothetical protein KNAG_0F01950 [Kazachstania naganishii CBS 8797]
MADGAITGVKVSGVVGDVGSWRDCALTERGPRYTRVDEELVHKYFNENAVVHVAGVAEDSYFVDTDFNFRVCRGCGRPIALRALEAHLASGCAATATTHATATGGNAGSTGSGGSTAVASTHSNVDSDDDGARDGMNGGGSGNRSNGNHSDNDRSENDRSGDESGSDSSSGSDGEENTQGKRRTGDKKRPPSALDGEDEDDDDDDDDDDEDDDEDDEDGSVGGTPGYKRSKTGTPSGARGKVGKRRDKRVKQRNPTDIRSINFDKQCGVELPEGGYCARSLTCKSHSMGAKRAVQGRTKPFDELLADYHRIHQTKIGAAAEKRAKQQELQKLQRQILNEQKEQKKLQQKQHRTQPAKPRQTKATGRSRTAAGAGGGGGGGSMGGANGRSGTPGVSGSSRGATLTRNGGMSSDGHAIAGYANLSPEEETTQVLNGVSRSFPLPLESTVLSSTKYRTKNFRMREMFASSFSVRPGFSSPGYGAIHSRVGCLDLDRSTDYKFRIRTPQPINRIAANKNLAPQQIQKLQQQRMLHTQLQQQQQLLQQQQARARQQDKLPQASSTTTAQAQSAQSQSQSQPQPQATGLTPQEIQLQQQKLRQQQLQQQKFEAAAYHLANATKLMQNSHSYSNLNLNGSSAPNRTGSPPGPASNAGSPGVAVNQKDATTPAQRTVSRAGSEQVAQSPAAATPAGGRVNIGIGSPVNGLGGRVN